MIKEFNGKKPIISEDTYISEESVIIGEVILEKGVSVWSFAVLRGDLDKIHIRAFTNIQEGVIIHVDKGYPVEVGEGVVVGHSAVLHGCKIGNNCLIGMRAVILDGAEIEDGCIIGAGALVPQGKKIPKNSLVLGVPGAVVRQVREEELEDIKRNVSLYYELSKMYRGR
ncbi:MAG: gamma carbonic anhydrase family protein [Dictyoglomus sp. NZ13-RE01]|nr:MAG: gamma carbonic anhydrase family protein [Dictyoglomus sp. NZ13-RE01]